MKRILIIMIAILFVMGANANAQDSSSFKSDSTGLPGDNFSLPGALEMFKKAGTLEEFEKLLNQENNRVNNLDLNEDGKIDYVRVVDNAGNNAHAVVLQVPVNKTEFQDVAVIEVEKQGDAQVSVQIVGDEDVYGENVIFEPKNEKEVNSGDSKGGPSVNSYNAQFWFNVWYWPCVQFMYSPGYVVWVSPWYYDYYPYWWNPWRPFRYSEYWHHCHRYHDYYHHSYNHYGHNAYNNYRPHRKSSDYVVNRHRGDVSSYRSNRGNNRRENISVSPRRDQGRVGAGQTNYNRMDANRSTYNKPASEKVSSRNGVNSSEKNNRLNRTSSYERSVNGFKDKTSRGKGSNEALSRPRNNKSAIRRDDRQSKAANRPSSGEKPSRVARPDGKR